MYRNSLLDIFADKLVDPWKHQFLSGIVLVVFGVTIIVFPQILAVMVASAFIMAGFLLTSSAWMFKRMAGEYKRHRSGLYEWF